MKGAEEEQAVPLRMIVVERFWIKDLPFASSGCQELLDFEHPSETQLRPYWEDDS